MIASRVPFFDRTLALLAEGYVWLPERLRRAARPLVRSRLMGVHAVGLRGPDAVRFFYDEEHVRRTAAVPDPVLSTLFGHGAVHTLDGQAHRVRKAMFVSLLTEPERVGGLVDHVAAEWDDAVRRWTARSRVVLFDEAALIITRGVCRWAGIPVADTDAEPLTGDLVAMVDSFATAGPRHWRARRARRRREAWLAGVVTRVRNGEETGVSEGSAVDTVARHRDSDGQLLSPRVAAVEIINIIRPTVAVCWFVSFAAHALHRQPELKGRLLRDDPAYSTAFAHEIRRFYPFAPFVGGRTIRDLRWRQEPIPAGALVLLDLYGQNHDPALWDDPYTFDPSRFLDSPPEADELIPQGGGDVRTGHRCPGEAITTALLRALTVRLARLDYDVPEQRMDISLRRIPTRPRDGLVISGVRPTRSRRSEHAPSG